MLTSFVINNTNLEAKAIQISPKQESHCHRQSKQAKFLTMSLYLGRIFYATALPWLIEVYGE